MLAENKNTGGQSVWAAETEPAARDGALFTLVHEQIWIKSSCLVNDHCNSLGLCNYALDWGVPSVGCVTDCSHRSKFYRSTTPLYNNHTTIGSCILRNRDSTSSQKTNLKIKRASLSHSHCCTSSARTRSSTLTSRKHLPSSVENEEIHPSKANQRKREREKRRCPEDTTERATHPPKRRSFKASHISSELELCTQCVMATRCALNRASGHHRYHPGSPRRRLRHPPSRRSSCCALPASRCSCRGCGGRRK